MSDWERERANRRGVSYVICINRSVCGLSATEGRLQLFYVVATRTVLIVAAAAAVVAVVIIISLLK